MNPDGDLLLKLLVLALVIGQAASLWLGITRRKFPRTIEPQPLEIVAGRQFVTRETCDLLHRNMKSEIGAMDVQIKELRAQRDSDVTSMRSELSQLKAEVAALRALMESGHTTIAHVSAKLDRLIERQIPKA